MKTKDKIKNEKKYPSGVIPILDVYKLLDEAYKEGHSDGVSEVVKSPFTFFEDISSI